MSKIIGFFVILICWGCSNKYESIVNSAPALSFRFSKDTVRVREKDETNINATGNGNLSLYCPQALHDLNIVFSDTSGKVHFYYRGSSIKNGEPLIANDSVLLFVVCDTTGIYPVDFLLTDQLGRMIQQTMVVRCAANQKAVPGFFYREENTSSLQSWEYLFDGSNSKDPDGKIVSYHFLINGQAIDTNQPTMHFSFHAKGEHRIGLSVQDELGLYSDTLYKELIIQ